MGCPYVKLIVQDNTNIRFLPFKMWKRFAKPLQLTDLRLNIKTAIVTVVLASIVQFHIYLHQNVTKHIVRTEAERNTGRRMVSPFFIGPFAFLRLPR